MEVVKGKSVDEEVVQYYVGHGVPRGIAVQRQLPLDYCLELLTRIEMDAAIKVAKAIPPKKQRDWMVRTMNDPLERPYVFSITGEVSDRLAAAAGFLIFKQALLKANARTAPYWHQLDGSPKDELRDGYPPTRAPSLLVISNLAGDSTMMKMEKVRDLLAQYAHVPRIVLASGVNPVSLFSSILFKQADRFMFYGSQEGE